MAELIKAMMEANQQPLQKPLQEEIQTIQKRQMKQASDFARMVYERQTATPVQKEEPELV